MDPLDFAIYRFLSPDGEARFWAGRRLIDPTIPVRAIADQVGISENGVRARLRGLSELGFLRGRAVTPNPSLFGVRVFVQVVPVGSAGEAERVFRDLALVDGVVFARDTLDEGQREVRAHFVSETESTTTRRAALIGRLSPTSRLRPPQLYWIPPCERELSPLDWRLLQAFRAAPDATVAAIAKTVRVSLKTTARRYHQMIDARACWWTHGADAEEFPLALVRIELRDAESRHEVVGKVPKEAPVWMPVASDGLGLEPGNVTTTIAGLVPADAPTVLERLVTKLAGLPGVVSVRRTFALGSRSYPEWFTERIAERVAVPS